MKNSYLSFVCGAAIVHPLAVISFQADASGAGDAVGLHSSAITNFEKNRLDDVSASSAIAAAPPFIYSGIVPITVSLAAPDGFSPADQNLRIVHKIHKQMDVGLLLVGALMGSFRLPVSKEHYKGATVHDILHPANEFFVPAVSKLVDEWINENGAAVVPYKNAILIRPNTMVLVYVNFDAENPKYDFYLRTTVSRSPDFRGFFALDAPPQVLCADKYSEPALDIDHWQANDYAEVHRRVRNHIDQCLPKIKAGLAKLLAA